MDIFNKFATSLGNILDFSGKSKATTEDWITALGGIGAIMALMWVVNKLFESDILDFILKALLVITGIILLVHAGKAIMGLMDKGKETGARSDTVGTTEVAAIVAGTEIKDVVRSKDIKFDKELFDKIARIKDDRENPILSDNGTPTNFNDDKFIGPVPSSKQAELKAILQPGR